jgi:DNA-binding HxlR family transcriptional regulator
MSPVTLTGALSDRDSWSAESCSLAAALDVIGRRATMLLLREALYGARRFDEFIRRAGFTEAVTAARLHELVDEGLLERRPYQEPGQRSRDEYHLTEKGRDLFPAVVALMRWGDKWAQPDGGPVAFTHADCGAPIDTDVHCAKGHPVSIENVEAGLRRPARGH